MLRAIETALAGYADRGRDIARLAQAIAVPDKVDARRMADLMVNQRAAEVDLVVARVADECTESLIHVVA
jgi:hypothetical protein